MEFVLTALGELLLQVVGELLIDFGAYSLGNPLQNRGRAHPVLAALGTALMGVVAGLLTSLIWPTRVLDPLPFRGLSLVLSPAIAGLAMDRYGRWREGRGMSRSYLATFWGGAIFAFSMALVRFLWVGA